ncbi:MAG TPA: hypothetical protein VFM48_11615 [Aquabacterium sp.]|nr:hypothetical protein [Aquabacterium sp.]
MRKQQGFSSILLVAIIVLLAGMTAFALRFVAATQGSSSLQVQAMRAQRAAQAAVEWQRYRLRLLSPGGCALSSSFTVPLVSGNFPVTVTCARTPTAATTYTENPSVGPPRTVYTYRFTATACWPASAGVCPNPTPPSNYVEKQVTAQAACLTGPTSCTW